MGRNCRGDRPRPLPRSRQDTAQELRPPPSTWKRVAFGGGTLDLHLVGVIFCLGSGAEQSLDWKSESGRVGDPTAATYHELLSVCREAPCVPRTATPGVTVLLYARALRIRRSPHHVPELAQLVQGQGSEFNTWSQSPFRETELECDGHSVRTWPITMMSLSSFFAPSCVHKCLNLAEFDSVLQMANTGHPWCSGFEECLPTDLSP